MGEIKSTLDLVLEKTRDLTLSSEEKEEQKQKEPNPEPPKTKQEVEQLLNSLDQQPDNLQRQMAEQKGVAVPTGRLKDW